MKSFLTWNIGGFQISFRQHDNSKHEAGGGGVKNYALGLLSGCLWTSDAMWTSPDRPAREHMRVPIYPSLPRQGIISQTAQDTTI